MICVMGASGHTGKRIAETLLEKGERVRVLGRSPDRLASLVEAGAEAKCGDAGDREFLAEAFRGATACYVLVPPNVTAPDLRSSQDAQSEAIAGAVKDSGAKHVVCLSSLGAELPSGTGPIAGLHGLETRLGRVEGCNVLCLRAGMFFENFYYSLGMIKQQGLTGGAISPDLRCAMVATRDIADVASAALRARDWKGVTVREVLGPRDLSHAEATRILGMAIGKPTLKYVQFPYADYGRALEHLGLSPSVSAAYVEMARACNEGLIKSRLGRNAQSSTPTWFEEFVEELAKAYQGS